MRQTHAAGEKLFVDYAGDTVPVIVNRLTGEKQPAQIFVAVLGASSFSYAEATWTQSLSDWIAAHVRALEAIGGVPRLLVPDNPKVAIVKAVSTIRKSTGPNAPCLVHYRTPSSISLVSAAPISPRCWSTSRLRRSRAGFRRLRCLGLIKRVAKTYRYYLTRAGEAVIAAASHITEYGIVPALAKRGGRCGKHRTSGAFIYQKPVAPLSGTEDALQGDGVQLSCCSIVRRQVSAPLSPWRASVSRALTMSFSPVSVSRPWS